MRAIIIAILLGLCGCATEPWTSRDTRGEIIYAAALAADAYSTAQIQNHAGVWENNPLAESIYGRSPDPQSVFATAIIGGLVHWYIARRMRADLRPYWQYGLAFLHGKAARHNCAFDVDC